LDIKIALSTDSENPIVGDLYLENGTARTTSDDNLAETVAQDLRISLSLFQGEYFLDPTQGMPYWQSIIGQRTPIRVLTQLFASAIRSRPGVAAITYLAVTRVVPRGLSVVFTVKLTDGTTLSSTDFAPFIVGVTANG